MEENEAKTQEEKKKKCFVIMPISDIEGYPKGHFDRVFRHIIIPACNQAGYEAVRADATAKTNVIIVDILKNALNCDLVDKAIADLVKALKETQSMNENETNSLLKLLAVEAPAKLPNRLELSSDSSIILQAIHDLGEDVQRVMRRNRKAYRNNTNENSLITGLLNGQVVRVGDHIYDNKNKKEFGYVMDIIDDAIVVMNQQGIAEILVPSSLEAKNYSVMPF